MGDHCSPVRVDKGIVPEGDATTTGKISELAHTGKEIVLDHYVSTRRAGGIIVLQLENDYAISLGYGTEKTITANGHILYG